MLRIEDECVAFDFRMTCNARLLFYDADKEIRQLEAMTGQAITKQLGSLPRGRNITEITQDNFRDQGW